MKVTLLKVYNYKCFRESNDVRFSSGFNVVVGANNSEKTALLEALISAGLKNEPHRSAKYGGASEVVPTSRAAVDIVVTGSELYSALLRAPRNVHIPLPNNISNESAMEYLEKNLFAEHNETKFGLARAAGAAWVPRGWPSHGLFADNPNGRSIQVGPTPDRQAIRVASPVAANREDSLGTLVGEQILSATYVFRAERLNIGRSQIVPDVTLNPDAGNLPSALHLLQTRNPHQFDRLNGLIRQILPTIERITVVPVNQSEVEIRVWFSGYKLEREDLAISMASCGTGVGQVLAIVYLAVTSRTSRTIVIDEPSSFLHPSATRELLEVLRSEGRHQYILSTHAPEVISAAEPDTLTILKWNGAESETTTYDGANIDSARMALREIGARLSDVFGLDRVIWVEGQTEAASFPVIVKAKRGRMPVGVAFVPLVNTGDFVRRGNHGRLIGQIYRRLSAPNALMPQTVAISLDGEERTEGERKELSVALDGRVRFLPRRTLENYLLHPTALLRVIRAQVPELSDLTVEQIHSWIEHQGIEAKYKSAWTGDEPLLNSEWLATVDAPRLLSDLFTTLTENKLEYR